MEEYPMTTTMNGNVRKSLAEQIDRLDGILDGLAEGLSGAVADAVRDAVHGAVAVAVQAGLTNPELRRQLAPTAETARPTAPARPGVVARLAGAGKALVGRAADT